ncbi:MAG: 2-dehydropantoate 2-reductase [Vallitaleaceae bacterium]|jgi:2-dehydropantoate 2-reductase|nr:2-dehydropantoate 2-reductase [Vallitaleaceae bacterium]
MAIKTVGIVGMGALGVLFGEYLSNHLGKENVGFVLSAIRQQKYEKARVSLNGMPCDFRMISDQEGEPTVDLLIFTVKANALESAMETAKHLIGQHTVNISLLNGISSETIIGQRYGREKMLVTVAQGMDAVKIGPDLTYSKFGQLRIGTLEKDISNLEAVCRLFDKIALPYTRESDIVHRLWSKFMLNVGVNQVVMVYEGAYETVQQPGEPRDKMVAAMGEVIRLAKAEGIMISEEELLAYVSLVDTLSPTGMPSMRQDGLRHDYSEVELFSGTVLKLGKKHRIKTPVNEVLYHQIMKIEENY